MRGFGGCSWMILWDYDIIILSVHVSLNGILSKSRCVQNENVASPPMSVLLVISRTTIP